MMNGSAPPIICAWQGTAAKHTSTNATIRKTWIRKEHLQSEFPI
jgi:hypothetical protein